jgi:hypothetical protein
MEKLKENIPSWKEIYRKAPIEKKKLMLRAIIESVIVRREDVEINVKLHISHFCRSIYGSETDVRGREHRWLR